MSFTFGPDFRARLLALPEMVRKAGGDEGAAGARKGGRLEFREHRPYAPGDDPRDLDWNLFLRLGLLATKEYERAEVPEALVILDRSASMGPPGSAKDRIAREVAAGIAYAALAAGAQAAVAVPGEGGPVFLGRFKSPRRLDGLLGLLQELGDPQGPTWLAGLTSLPPAAAHGRVAFLLSDFLVPVLPAAVALALARGAGGGCLMPLLTAEERHPRLRAPGTLADPESGSRLFVPDGEALLRAYAVEIAAHEEAVTALARRHGLGLVPFSDERPFEHAVLACLAPQGRRS